LSFGNLATPEVLLEIVGMYPKLKLLHGNDEWAQGAGAITASKLVRRSDAEAAIETFMIKMAARAWNNVDDLSRALGGFLAKAKEYGDAARARASPPAEEIAASLVAPKPLPEPPPQRRPITLDERHARQAAARAALGSTSKTLAGASNG
jgi:hypothetical protein